jgi:hypothetical protein
MELFPEFKLGWLNGWLVIALLALTDGILYVFAGCAGSLYCDRLLGGGGFLGSCQAVGAL